MKISVMDAQHTLYEGAVSEATLPASGGELTLLDDHEPIFVALQRGAIRLVPIAQKKEELKPILIQQGLARMRNNELVILVE